MRTIGYILISIFFHVQVYCQALVIQGGPDTKNQINGVSFLGPSEATLDLTMFEILKQSNAEWVALIPEATLERSTMTLRPDSLNSYWSSTMPAQHEAITLAKQAGLKVFLKPHIVLSKLKSKPYDKSNGAVWRGDVILESDADWKALEESYAAYIIRLAELAEAMEVELFSVGTELREFVIHRPQFWTELIVMVRKIYNGQLIYCANWDEYDKVEFWNELDYIGVDAYFPISNAKTPKVRQLIKTWRSTKRKLKRLSKSKGKEILLTEFGYRNIDYAGQTPWVHDNGEATPNYQAQSNLYEAFFHTFWEEPWVAGGFLWNWLHTDLEAGDTDFSVRKKPVLTIIRQWYEVDATSKGDY